MSKRPLLWLALACQGLLSTLYLSWLPAHEGPDENDHCYYAYYLHSSGDLPIILGSAKRAGREPWEEASVGHHPPAYYALLAATMAVVGDGDCAPAWHLNPDWIGNHPEWQSADGGGAWAVEHPGSALHWKHGADELAPVSPEIRTLHWLRGWSVVFGAISVALTYALGRLLFPGHAKVAGAAALWLACVPQWSMMHGCLDNGNLAAACSHAVLVALVWAVRRQRLGPGTGALLGLLCGAALLTKLTALFLLPLVGSVYAVCWWVWPDRRRRLVLSAVLAAAVVALLSGWMFVRNARLYGDPLALDAHREAFASNTVPDGMLWDYLLGELPWRALRTGIGEFGWAIVPVPGWALALFGTGLALGLIGCVAGAKSVLRAAGPVLWIAIAAIALAVAGFVRFNTTYLQPQGRYLFPVYGPLLVLVAAGWFVPWAVLWARHRVAAGAVIAAPVAAAVAVLFSCFAPAFRVVPGSAEPWYASMVADLHTPAPPERSTIEALEPAPSAELVAAPTFRWRDDAARGDAEARYTLHFYTPSGRVIMAVYEWGGVLVEGQEWTFPDVFWKSIEAGAPFYWKVRRLPNRAAGETVADVPESPPRLLVRSR